MIATHTSISWRVVLSVPIVGVSALIIFLWWQCSIQTLFMSTVVGSGGFGSLLASLVITIGSAMTLWCYLTTALTHPGRAPSFLAELHPTPMSQVEDDLPPELRGNVSGTSAMMKSFRRRPPLVAPDGSVHCRLCKEPKPSRCHHDSASGQCILKMDHFCPWTGNTIGLCNYKPFFQFVVYACATSIVSVLCNFNIALGAMSHPSATQQAKTAAQSQSLGFSTVIAVALCLSFSISLCLFVAMHSCIISRNQTTIEAGLQDASHNLGSVHSNWEAVFGQNPLMWFVPLPANDTFVANRLGTYFRRSVASVVRSGEVRRWTDRQRDWQASHPRGLLLGWCFRGIGRARPSDWLFWWGASSHIGHSVTAHVPDGAALPGGGSGSELASLRQQERELGARVDVDSQAGSGSDGVFGRMPSMSLTAPGPPTAARGVRHGPSQRLPEQTPPPQAAPAAGSPLGGAERSPGIAASGRRKTLLKPRPSRTGRLPGSPARPDQTADAMPGHAHRPTPSRGPHRPPGHDTQPSKSAMAPPSRPSQASKKSRSVRLIV